jgi:hypothetical protein
MTYPLKGKTDMHAAAPRWASSLGWDFWRRTLEEMHRAMHYGSTYRFRRLVLSEEKIAKHRAARVALYAYRRMARCR